MHSIIEKNIPKIKNHCRKYRVRTLSIFGSATRKSFDPSTSDLDMIVEFEKMPPSEHAKRYFGLLADLEDVLKKPVDLIESGPIRNPYFREAIEESQVVIYAAPAVEVLLDRDLMEQIGEGKKGRAKTRDFEDLAQELGI